MRDMHDYRFADRQCDRIGFSMKLIKLPDNFQRLPCPQSNSVLEGAIEVPLGTWLVGGKNRRLHMRICGSDLEKLAEVIAWEPDMCKFFGHNALQVFFAANEP